MFHRSGCDPFASSIEKVSPSFVADLVGLYVLLALYLGNVKSLPRGIQNVDAHWGNSILSPIC